MEQSEYTQHLSIKFSAFICGSWSPKNNYNSNIKGHWSQITISNEIIIIKYEIGHEWPECNRDTKWANAFGKIVLIDLVDTGFPQTSNLWKMWYLQSKMKWGMLYISNWSEYKQCPNFGWKVGVKKKRSYENFNGFMLFF